MQREGFFWKKLVHNCNKVRVDAKLYIPSTPNNSNVTHTFMCLGRTGRFGQR